MRAVILVLFIFLGGWHVGVADEVSLPQVPEGFVIEQVAGQDLVRFPMFACFDGQGGLYVAESSGLDLYAEISAATRKCRISHLEDTDGDGVFDRSVVFADQLVYPMGLASSGGFGDLYVADPPDVVVLTDTDYDGRADMREVILSGFGHIDNGSLHGLVFGPDGWLYLTMGSPDGYRFTMKDGREVTGKSGALIRCLPDGSRPEVICRGFVNLVEIAFLPSGDIIGTDNWFQLPSGGVRDALVHLVDGGLYPYLEDDGTPQVMTGVTLPAVSLFPAVALSGLECYRGASFGAEFQGNLFSAQHNSRCVGRHVLAREGSTFRSTDSLFVTSDNPDFHPSDLLEDADGSLLVIDTGGWYVQHCPTGQIRDSFAPGGIWRVRRKDAEREKDPWGHELEPFDPSKETSHARVVKWLSDTRPQVRRIAQSTLGSIWQMQPDVPRASIPRDPLGAEGWHWATALADSQLPNSFLPAIETNALQIAETRLKLAKLDAPAQADSPAPWVTRAKAELAARAENKEALPEILAALDNSPDPILAHSLLHAVFHLVDDSEQLAAWAADHQKPAALRRAAVMFLDQPPHHAATMDHARIALADANPSLRDAGVWLLKRHPDWAGDVAELIREFLTAPEPSEHKDAAVRELAAAFLADPRVAPVVAQAIAGDLGNLSGERRALLAVSLTEAPIAELPFKILPAIGKLLAENDEALVQAGVKLTDVFQVSELDDQLAALSTRSAASPELKFAALRAVVGRRGDVIAPALSLLLDYLADDRGPADRLASAEILGRATLESAAVDKLLDAVGNDPLISPQVFVPMLGRSVTPPTAGRVAAYLAEAIDGGWRPDQATLAPLRQRLADTDPSLAGELETRLAQATADQRARLAQYEPLLAGGDARRGREVFAGKKVACATCHKVGAEGGLVGPDLTRVGAIRAGRDILESIVVPSSTFAQGYENYVLVTTAGQTATGILARQDSSGVVLREASGAERRFSQEAIDELARAPHSIMPDALVKAMSDDEFRDLLAYLQSLK